ncbi:MAG TPA: hypothetical protein VKD72_20155 [Gemmataceae bacterium]|nr:hypothetical protein [Gemmataceae bacterium]
MSGAWGFALLQQSEQVGQGFSGELCAEPRHVVAGQAGGRDGDAQAHAVTVADDDMAGALRGMADRQDGEASAEQRMSGVGYLDLAESLIRRVLEQGIVLLSRSTPWIMLTCGSFSGSGYATGCCSVCWANGSTPASSKGGL